jgi:hypothetical protein
MGRRGESASPADGIHPRSSTGTPHREWRAKRRDSLPAVGARRWLGNLFARSIAPVELDGNLRNTGSVWGLSGAKVCSEV